MTLPQTMRAMVTMGHGDLGQIVLLSNWPRPEPKAGEVLIKVGACGLNNTDANTCSGRYPKAVTQNLPTYIEAGAIRPALAATYPLELLHQAQAGFIRKEHTGNIVVIP